MGKDIIEQVTSQGSAAVSQVNLEGEEWIPGNEMHRCGGLRKQGSAGQDSCQPLLFYLCLKFNINQGGPFPSRLSQERKALLHVMGRARVTEEWW